MRLGGYRPTRPGPSAHAGDDDRLRLPGAHAGRRKLFREPLADEEIKERHGLTAQEIRVARLIAEGLRNVDVARNLRISPHTARRLTERVLEKLGIAARAQVAERIRRA